MEAKISHESEKTKPLQASSLYSGVSVNYAIMDRARTEGVGGLSTLGTSNSVIDVAGATWWPMDSQIIDWHEDESKDETATRYRNLIELAVSFGRSFDLQHGYLNTIQKAQSTRESLAHLQEHGSISDESLLVLDGLITTLKADFEVKSQEGLDVLNEHLKTNPKRYGLLVYPDTGYVTSEVARFAHLRGIKAFKEAELNGHNLQPIISGQDNQQGLIPEDYVLSNLESSHGGYYTCMRVAK